MEPMPTVTCGIPRCAAATWPENSATSLTTRSGANSSMIRPVSGSAARAFNRPNSPVST